MDRMIRRTSATASFCWCDCKHWHIHHLHARRCCASAHCRPSNFSAFLTPNNPQWTVTACNVSHLPYKYCHWDADHCITQPTTAISGCVLPLVLVPDNPSLPVGCANQCMFRNTLLKSSGFASAWQQVHRTSFPCSACRLPAQRQMWMMLWISWLSCKLGSLNLHAMLIWKQ